MQLTPVTFGDVGMPFAKTTSCTHRYMCAVFVCNMPNMADEDQILNQRILAALSKLQIHDTQQTGTHELSDLIEVLVPRTLSLMVVCMIQCINII